jgi:transcriptional regulator with XRE-family HTH domain
MANHDEAPPAPETDTPVTPEAIVAVNVVRLREALGITQAELAARTSAAGHGLAKMAIWTIEIGKRRIRVDDLYALAEVLGVTPQCLLDPDYDPDRSPSPDARQHAVGLDGGTTEPVTADTVEDVGGWLNFYLRGERVFFASSARVLCVRIAPGQEG